MKRNITKKDIESLTESQKVSLRELWLPEKYDLAVAYICKDAETEEYDEIEFVVGRLILNRTHITLFDIRGPEFDEKDTSENIIIDDQTDLDANIDQDAEPEFEFDGEFNDEDFEFAYERPTTFNKEDCLPLLSITQMLEIFERRIFKDANFYITSAFNEKGCELGNSSFSLEDYGNNNEPAELCDVLWENLKALL